MTTDLLVTLTCARCGAAGRSRRETPSCSADPDRLAFWSQIAAAVGA